jgi:hypothetical protein
MFLEATADLSTSVAKRPALKMTVLLEGNGLLGWGGTRCSGGGWWGSVGRGWSRGSGWWLGWGGGFGWGFQDESFADEGEAFLGEFCLEELVFGAGEKIRRRTSDRGDEVMNRDWFAVERALLVSICGKLNRLN